MESGDMIGVLADISGKGVAASLLSSMLLGCLQMLLYNGETLHAALTRLNRFLLERAPGKFATMFIFSISPDGTGQFISAGHNPAYLYRAAENDIQELESTSMVVGAFSFATVEARPLALREGDVLFVYSDGLTEAGNPAGEMFGEAQVKEIIRKEAPSGTEKLLAATLDAIHQFTKGADQTDDITMVMAQLATKGKSHEP
jgi:sigma-B regulation protein RsbU (phosphoserine phosphatase)